MKRGWAIQHAIHAVAGYIARSISCRSYRPAAGGSERNIEDIILPALRQLLARRALGRDFGWVFHLWVAPPLCQLRVLVEHQGEAPSVACAAALVDWRRAPCLHGQHLHLGRLMLCRPERCGEERAPTPQRDGINGPGRSQIGRSQMGRSQIGIFWLAGPQIGGPQIGGSWAGGSTLHVLCW